MFLLDYNSYFSLIFSMKFENICIIINMFN